MTFLFNDIVFGPVHSRRFGVSLGINLLPENYKYCTFNCIYCECGWTYGNKSGMPTLPGRDEVRQALEDRLKKMQQEGRSPDHITFAGNGEPTIHPEFEGIIEDTLSLRDQFFSSAEVTVLSNASLLHKKSVFRALDQVDNNVLKLDSAFEETFQKINQPAGSIRLGKIMDNIRKFNGNQVVQTLFMRGSYQGQWIDNTTEEEITAWIDALKSIRPKYVMIYPIARDTAAAGIEKIPEEELAGIAERAEQAGIKTKLYY